MSIDTQAYLFVHFIGEERNPTDEQLYFALSRDGVHWRDLRPAGSPALTWLGGEKGVRDPHIVRDPRGGFHIVATDLSIYYRGGWGPTTAPPRTARPAGDLGLPRPGPLERTAPCGCSL